MAHTPIAKFMVPYQRGIDDSGLGVHLLTGDRTAETAFKDIEFKQLDKEPSNLEQLHKVCTTRVEYEENQETSLGADGSKDSIAVGGGMQLLVEKSLSQKRIICLSIGSIVTQTTTYDDKKVTLTPLAEEILSRKGTGPDEFIKRFGTHFIGGYVAGANFFSRISIDTITSEDKSALSLKLNASYGGDVKGGGKGEASYGLEQIKRDYECKIEGRFSASGLSGNMSVTSLEQVGKAFAEFSVSAQKQPSRTVAICFPYSMLARVTEILNSHQEGRTLQPSVGYDLVSTICRETRRIRRIGAEIAEYDEIAQKRGKELMRINETYKRKLDSEMTYYRSLKLSELSQPPELLQDRLVAVAAAADGTTSDEGSGLTKSMLIYFEWRDAFKKEYHRII